MKIFLKTIDMYGKPFNFSINQDLLHKTIVGGILTILTFLITILSFFYFGRNCFNRLNPNTSTSKIVLEKYPLYNITKNNFIFGFRIEDDYGNIWNESEYFSFKVIYHDIKIERDKNGKCNQTDYPVPMTYKMCTENLVDRLNISDRVDSLSFYCMDIDNLSVGGYWDYSVVRYIDLVLLLCRLDSNKEISKCKSVNETLDLLLNKKLYLNILSMRYFANLESIENPLVNLLSYSYVMLDINFYKKQNAYFKLGSFNSDDGIFFESKHFYESFSLDSWSYDQINNDNFDRKIIVTRIYFTKFNEIFDRQYLKIQSFYPTLITTINLISLLLSNINNYFNDLILRNHLISELYDISGLDHKKERKLELKKSQIRKVMLYNFTYNNNNNFIKSKTNDTSIILKNTNKLDKKALGPLSYERNIAIPEGLKNVKLMPEQKRVLAHNNTIFLLPFTIQLKIFCCKSFFTTKEKFKFRLFQKGISLIMENINIVSFLKNIKQLNDIKTILFSHIQLKCLNHLKKPSLDNYDIFLTLKEDEDQQKLQIIDYFYRLPSMDKIDRAIFENLDNDIKLVIDSLNCKIAPE